jgi:hypothetical protein
MSQKGLLYTYGPRNQNVIKECINPCDPMCHLKVNDYITSYRIHFTNACRAKNIKLVSELLELSDENHKIKKYGIDFKECLFDAMYKSIELCTMVINKAISCQVTIDFHELDLRYIPFEISEFICLKALECSGQCMTITKSVMTCEQLLHLSRKYNTNVYFTRLDQGYRKYLDKIEDIVGQLFPNDLVNYMFEFLR